MFLCHGAMPSWSWCNLGRFVTGMSGRQFSHLTIEAVEETLKGYMESRAEIVLAYLFGSFLEKGQRPVHDIDIAIVVVPDLFEKMDSVTPFGYRAWMSTELCRLLKSNFVDLVLLNQATPLLCKRVIKTGKLIFCRSEAERVRFQVSSLKRFADTAHLRQIKRRYMKQRIAKGLAGYDRSQPH